MCALVLVLAVIDEFSGGRTLAKSTQANSLLQLDQDLLVSAETVSTVGNHNPLLDRVCLAQHIKSKYNFPMQISTSNINDEGPQNS